MLDRELNEKRGLDLVGASKTGPVFKDVIGLDHTLVRTTFITRECTRALKELGALRPLSPADVDLPGRLNLKKGWEEHPYARHWTAAEKDAWALGVINGRKYGLHAASGTWVELVRNQVEHGGAVDASEIHTTMYRGDHGEFWVITRPISSTRATTLQDALERLQTMPWEYRLTIRDDGIHGRGMAQLSNITALDSDGLIEVRVNWEDTDTGGLVTYATFKETPTPIEEPRSINIKTLKDHLFPGWDTQEAANPEKDAALNAYFAMADIADIVEENLDDDEEEWHFSKYELGGCVSKAKTEAYWGILKKQLQKKKMGPHHFPNEKWTNLQLTLQALGIKL